MMIDKGVTQSPHRFNIAKSSLVSAPRAISISSAARRALYLWAISGDGGASFTQMQARLLETFLRHPNKVLTRKSLMKEVWQVTTALRTPSALGQRRTPTP